MEYLLKYFLFFFKVGLCQSLIQAKFDWLCIKTVKDEGEMSCLTPVSRGKTRTYQYRWASLLIGLKFNVRYFNSRKCVKFQLCYFCQYKTSLPCFYNSEPRLWEFLKEKTVVLFVISTREHFSLTFISYVIVLRDMTRAIGILRGSGPNLPSHSCGKCDLKRWNYLSEIICLKVQSKLNLQPLIYHVSPTLPW